MRFFSAVFLLLMSMQANAALINNGDWTTDDVSGLDWLDLSFTGGQAYDSVIGINSGWRYATNTEIENIFGILFDGYYDTDTVSGFSAGSQNPYSDQREDVEAFHALFGGIPYYGSYYAYGLYEDEDDVLRLMGTFYGANVGFEDLIYGLEFSNSYENFRHDGDATGVTGTFLVRATSVPEPATLALMSLGLAGLGISRRKKS